MTLDSIQIEVFFTNVILSSEERVDNENCHECTNVLPIFNSENCKLSCSAKPSLKKNFWVLRPLRPTGYRCKVGKVGSRSKCENSHFWANYTN